LHEQGGQGGNEFVAFVLGQTAGLAASLVVVEVGLATGFVVVEVGLAAGFVVVEVGLAGGFAVVEVEVGLAFGFAAGLGVELMAAGLAAGLFVVEVDPSEFAAGSTRSVAAGLTSDTAEVTTLSLLSIAADVPPPAAASDGGLASDDGSDPGFSTAPRTASRPSETLTPTARSAAKPSEGSTSPSLC